MNRECASACGGQGSGARRRVVLDKGGCVLPARQRQRAAGSGQQATGNSDERNARFLTLPLFITRASFWLMDSPPFLAPFLAAIVDGVGVEV